MARVRRGAQGRRRLRAALVAATMIAAGTVVLAPSAQAIDQDLVVSTTIGPPGTEIEVSSTSCSGSDPDSFQSLTARLVVGAARDERFAGIALSGNEDGGPAVLVVPDWIDPDAPAVIEATCSTETIDEDYDPVVFDPTPGAGAPQQLRTFSRTTLLAGQGFRVDVAGCGIPGASAASVAIFRTDDLSGRDLDGFLFDDEVALAGGVATVELLLSDRYTYEGDREGPVPPGRYAVFTSCFEENEGQNRTLVYEPQLIEVIGSAPTGGIEASFDRQARTLTVSGSGCVGAQVTVELTVFDEARSGGAGRRLDDGGSTLVAVPDRSGNWTATDEVAFAEGFVEVFATCGDPFADGFAYDLQGVEVQGVQATTSVPVTVPPTVDGGAPVLPGQPGPAIPIAGSPSFTG